MAYELYRSYEGDTKKETTNILVCAVFHGRAFMSEIPTLFGSRSALLDDFQYPVPLFGDKISSLRK